MHSKVIITSLIFGLAVSLAPVVVSTVGANAKKDACDVVEPASQALELRSLSKLLLRAQQ